MVNDGYKESDIQAGKTADDDQEGEGKINIIQEDELADFYGPVTGVITLFICVKIYWIEAKDPNSINEIWH